MTTPEGHEVDPIIVEAVQSVANRFGTAGLADMIALAQEQLRSSEEAMEELGNS